MAEKLVLPGERGAAGALPPVVPADFPMGFQVSDDGKLLVALVAGVHLRPVAPLVVVSQYKIFLITDRYAYERNSTEKNLVRFGYHSWEALFLREPQDYEKSVVVYMSEKRLKIEQDGFRIRGHSGD